MTFTTRGGRQTVSPIVWSSSGEQIFIIGGNGSGKSTLAMLLTGLYQPVGRDLLGWGGAITQRLSGALFSAIFTDYHLFQHLLGPEPKEASWLPEWLDRLQMGSKLTIEDEKHRRYRPLPGAAQAGRLLPGTAGRAAGGDTV